MGVCFMNSINFQNLLSELEVIARHTDPVGYRALKVVRARLIQEFTDRGILPKRIAMKVFSRAHGYPLTQGDRESVQ